MKTWTTEYGTFREHDGVNEGADCSNCGRHLDWTSDQCLPPCEDDPGRCPYCAGRLGLRVSTCSDGGGKMVVKSAMPGTSMDETKLVAYTIIPEASGSRWVRVGDAKLLEDGSVHVKLDAFPLSGELWIGPKEVNEELLSARMP